MKVVVIEDEKMASKRLVKMIAKLDKDIEVAAVLEGVEESVKYIDANGCPDLFIMDIQLSDGISFEIFDLSDVTCPVIFTTAYDEYALKAFKVHALDYLLKPIKESELTEAIDRFQDIHASQSESVRQLSYPGKSKKLLVKIGHNLKVLELDEAAYYYSESKISFFMDKDGKRYPVDYSLDRLEKLLNPNRFFRVNRQYIINEDSIQNMVSYSTSRIKLHVQPEPRNDVIVSKEKASRFRKWLVSS